MAISLTCEECDIASTCRKEQKERLEPCRDIVPPHCGDAMKLVRVENRRHVPLGPLFHFLCTKCGSSGSAATHPADVPLTPGPSLADRIKPTVSQVTVPETGHSDD
ncbi:hypothetical protein A2856_01790 [Candidatus Uhrbacteria bacterium RIFCSPHIGHO2_01_FULL_63_20]|uniref:Uncharacterized protein n=1 Tax=Candidatus Uhrbacteria bacterium RIFCSPHIGHO2_01_FULL_63_20 TaxID=1802385 RepID=A0A1F7TK99_9BACT|nr:MAG: hypothetical protein A2856_01790 [Candidatus Uhrbacteria bacterium RIFCSPHIGHO2_01_FULL_63_20]